MKKRHKFRIGQTKTPPINFKQSLANIARQFMYAQQKLNPLIIKDNMPPVAAIVLISCYADAVIAGKENSPSHKMTEREVIGASNLLVLLWKEGLFQPSEDFPYTLEQILSEMEEG